MIHKNLILESQPTGRVSEYFTYEEFTRSKYGNPIFNSLSKYLLKYLCLNILDPLRMQLDYPLLITSGVRDINVVKGLIRAGYHPSSSTDHSFGDPEFNPYGSGAADIRPYAQGSCEEIFNLVVDFINHIPEFQIGQVLWERQGTSEWVHISNPKSVLFQPEIERMIASRLMVGYGLDGKYYTEKPWT